MKNFLSCDWGSTSFRLRLVDAAAWQYSTVKSKDTGIVTIFQLWKQSATGEQGRFDFYLQVIGRHIRMLESQSGHSLKNLPLVISGMASSSLGMMEMGYKKIPVFADGRDLEVKKIAGTKDVKNDLYIISGVRTDDDAMRGEETQLAGCESDLINKRILVFPGTHSKHVTVRKGMVTGIKTFMTGEFFELLGEKSILSSSVRRSGGLHDKQNKKSFEAGVLAGRQSNLLHTAFLVRTNRLFNKLTEEENYYFLNGLIIGAETGEITEKRNNRVTLVVSGKLKPLYSAAFHASGFRESENNFQTEDADLALVKGQWRVLQQYCSDNKFL